MRKKSLAKSILEYLRRNEREQDPPPGYRSIKEWCKTLGCTKRMWNIILGGLMKSGVAKAVKLRRVSDSGKICIYTYYSIEEKFLKQFRSN